MIAHAQTGATVDYYFDQVVVRQAYERLYCQEGRAAIEQRLKSDMDLRQRLKLHNEDPDKFKLFGSDFTRPPMSEYKRDKYQQCLVRLASGENFGLSTNLRGKLIDGLDQKNCSHKLIKVTLEPTIADAWKRQLVSGRPTTEDIRTQLVSALELALGEIFCDYNPEEPYPR